MASSWMILARDRIRKGEKEPQSGQHTIRLQLIRRVHEAGEPAGLGWLIWS